MARLEPLPGGYYLWKYLPSSAAAGIFLVFFLGASLVHGYLWWKSRATFCICFLIGGIFEIIGYAARLAAREDTTSIMIYSIQSIFILLGPVLFAASIYMTLGRIIQCVNGEKYSLVPLRWLTKLFVSGDVVSFLVQGGGSGLMATASMGNVGKNIVVAGLIIQVIIFGGFILVSIMFQVRLRQNPTQRARDEMARSAHDVSWKTYLYMLYTVSILIMVRSIFRVAEFAMGETAYLLTHEWPSYIFDSLPMGVAMVIWVIWYPGWIGRPKDGSQLLPMARSNSEGQETF